MALEAFFVQDGADLFFVIDRFGRREEHHAREW
jgi:hypothetical protein